VGEEPPRTPLDWRRSSTSYQTAKTLLCKPSNLRGFKPNPGRVFCRPFGYRAFQIKTTPLPGNIGLNGQNGEIILQWDDDFLAPRGCWISRSGSSIETIQSATCCWQTVETSWSDIWAESAFRTADALPKTHSAYEPLSGAQKYWSEWQLSIINYNFHADKSPAVLDYFRNRNRRNVSHKRYSATVSDLWGNGTLIGQVSQREACRVKEGKMKDRH
jgi:hypothetical protein